MWHSEADIMNDLAALNDFGDPDLTEPYKILGTIGRGSTIKKKKQHETFLDQRTGEEIEVGNNCLSLEDVFYRGKGRGSIKDRSYSLLHKQLRLARPLGSSDEIIESYCRRNHQELSSKQVETSPVLTGSQSLDAFKKSETYCPLGFNKTSRVKAVRNSNLFNNALIASLLKAKEISVLGSEREKSNEPKIIDTSHEVCGCKFKNGEMINDAAYQTDSCSDSLSWSNAEDATLESLCNFSKSSNAEKMLDKIKISEDENGKSIDSTEDFNADLGYNEYEKFENPLKYENDVRYASYCIDTDQNQSKGEIYKKLGERLNSIRGSSNQRKNKEYCLSKKNLIPVNERFQDASDIKPDANKFLYNGLNFPPLV